MAEQKTLIDTDSQTVKPDADIKQDDSRSSPTTPGEQDADNNQSTSNRLNHDSDYT